MKNLYYINNKLPLCRLFSHFDDKKIKNILSFNNTYVKSYNSKDMIFSEGETCNYLSVILDGVIEIQKFDSDGNVLIVSTLNEGNVFGENLLFGDRHLYPMSVICKESSSILHISKDCISLLCRDDHIFLKELLRMLSNKALTLSSKLKQVSMKSLRHMICDFLFIRYNKSDNLKIKLNMSKKEWAEKLGVQRPSLSRELIKMKEEGLIDYDREFIYILKLDNIKKYI
ncbi:Crp/Fnr family transcriptional regulator [Clostridium fallax]|uniref:cAMP-binding domain of CRP or a regulatory subunit of cAMP-dependent protein kinases n=1 Tax=Clostridium fallax TaxID=1533 RepID=A0A1M4TB92_9CLOT|nr:Crp/Fnr family transcriptional regulator [Clostridium fallax]SHE41497.1 cAMP-binding domain of CRP or a regulatory subunit of cAMP-dependent protein kinases [Clostridium fallax]SQB22676.1 cyclic nucleotide-binding protein [Clostridium fallax]